MARRFAERENQTVILDTQRQQVVMENEFDRHELEDFALGIKGHRIDEFQAIGRSQRAPGIFLGGEIQIGNGAVLRQVEPCLATADLFELLRRKLAFFEQ